MGIIAKQTANVLIAEDNLADMALLEIFMKKGRINFNIHHARDGDEALKFLTSDENAPKLDLIFLDVNMPKCNGHEVAEFIRSNEHLKETPVCMLSGSDEVRDIEASSKTGVAGYVVKPLNAEKLQDVVASMEHLYFEDNDGDLYLCRKQDDVR